MMILVFFSLTQKRKTIFTNKNKRFSSKFLRERRIFLSNQTLQNERELIREVDVAAGVFLSLP